MSHGNSEIHVKDGRTWYSRHIQCQVSRSGESVWVWVIFFIFIGVCMSLCKHFRSNLLEIYFKYWAGLSSRLFIRESESIKTPDLCHFSMSTVLKPQFSHFDPVKTPDKRKDSGLSKRVQTMGHTVIEHLLTPFFWYHLSFNNMTHNFFSPLSYTSNFPRITIEIFLMNNLVSFIELL